MRPIIFRGKREDNGKWVYGFYVRIGKSHFIFTGKLKIVGLNVDFECYEVIPETVGQYTGLTDKNGKKIFEGDIVKIHRKYLNAGCEEDCFYRVDWHKSWNAWSLTNIKAIQSCYLYQANDGEVIGNIHDDNPELLEVE